MAGIDINQRFTIEKYYSKAEIAKALHTNLIEPLWKEIVDFRSKLSIVLPLIDTSRAHFTLTYVDLITTKSTNFNDLISNYISSYSKIKKGTVPDYTFTHDMLKNSLKMVAKINHIDVSEVTLTNIVDDKPVGPECEILKRFKKALLNFENSSFNLSDEEFLANGYAILRGENELTSFYRVNDIESASSKALVDREYDQGVPAHLIEEMMNSLFEYIDNSDVSLVARLIAILFMFNYVKPFEKYNFELSALLAKRVIALSNVNVSAIYLPIELIFADHDFFDEVSKEVKKTHDFTYAFVKGCEVLNDAVIVANTRINEVHAEVLDAEVKLGSDPKKIKAEFGIETVSQTQSSRVETKNQIQERLERPLNDKEFKILSEKDLKAKMNDLLELDPYLSKGQAHFYVHHCEPGRFYSIQQYVKFENCVYETGRTSLDNLAARGYYKKESIKNKFVYTPIIKE